ncbi:MAG TPA: PRC-barrel domain-containing protein [Acidimicrobiales bacterium]|jgi:PRC-barrel domain|nr:PRC-barrel domain-containing protein [Acidimicrobiales bacterium]
MRMELGLPVECSDGRGGNVRDLVVDPARRRLTHIVVERHPHLAHLVPIEDVARTNADDDALRLDCTVAEFERRYPEIEETALVRLGEWPTLDEDDWEVGVSTILSAPFFDSDGFELTTTAAPAADDRMLMAYDRIPAHEVEMQRGSAVEAADGTFLGHVDSFLVDDEGRITHLVLERGHLWRRRDITIPVTAVAQLHTDKIRLSLSRDDVGALPAVRGHGHRRLRHPGTST